jgi:hypothetical protein
MKRVLPVLFVALAACGGSSPTAPPQAPPPPTTLAPRPLWTLSGAGNTVFDVPTTVQRVRIQGTWTREGNSNFAVFIGGRLLVNEILRDSITYDGTHLTSGGIGETRSSTNIVWSFTEVR